MSELLSLLTYGLIYGLPILAVMFIGVWVQLRYDDTPLSWSGWGIASGVLLVLTGLLFALELRAVGVISPETFRWVRIAITISMWAAVWFGIVVLLWWAMWGPR